MKTHLVTAIVVLQFLLVGSCAHGQTVGQPVPLPVNGKAMPTPTPELLKYLQGNGAAADSTALVSQYTNRIPWGVMWDPVPMLFKDVDGDGKEDFCRVVEQAFVTEAKAAAVTSPEDVGPSIITVVLCSFGSAKSHWSEPGRKDRIAIFADPVPTTSTAKTIFAYASVKTAWLHRLRADGRASTSLCRIYSGSATAGRYVSCGEMDTSGADVIKVMPSLPLHVPSLPQAPFDQLHWADINKDGAVDICWHDAVSKVPFDNVSQLGTLRPIITPAAYGITAGGENGLVNVGSMNCALSGSSTTSTVTTKLSDFWAASTNKAFGNGDMAWEVKARAPYNWITVVKSPALALGSTPAQRELWIDLDGGGIQFFCREVGDAGSSAVRFLACRKFANGAFSSTDQMEIVR